jgi:hypothetical protein
MEMTVYFIDPETGDENSYSLPVYIHEEVHYEGIEE